MLILGGSIGFVVCLFFVALPLAGAIATQMGMALAIPGVGTALSPLFVPSILVGVVINIVLVLISYVMVSLSVAPVVPAAGPLPVAGPGAPPAAWQSPERFWRGVMIGMNSCVTMVLTGFFWPWATQWIPGLGTLILLSSGLFGIAGFVIGFANLMALDESICADRNYAAMMGWSSWVAGGSLLVNTIGLIFLIISVVSAVFGVFVRVTFEWWTGSFVVHGGPLHITAVPTAYDLGNVLLVDPRLATASPTFLPAIPVTGGGTTSAVSAMTVQGLTFHETGHTLNVAVFGSWFHLIGAIDENYVSSNGLAVYSELLPEGHARGAARPWMPLWAPPIGPVGLTANVPPTLGTPTVVGPAATAGGRIIAASGDTLTLTGNPAAGAPLDPDTYPQGAVLPGVSAPLGFLWAVTAQPATDTVIATPTAANTTAIVTTGGDHVLVFAVTDGIDFPGGGSLVAPDGVSLPLFTVSVVQAVISGAAPGTVNTPIALNANASTAGTDGGVGGPIPFTVLWTVTPVTAGSPFTLTPNNTAANVTFTAQAAGDYRIDLTVTENVSGSSIAHTATTTITIA